jgi:YfiR/HmsC-like
MFMKSPSNFRRFVCLLALVASAGTGAPVWASDAGVRWAFVMNFSRYTEWPTQKWANASVSFNVCLLPGDRDMSVELAALDKHVIAGRALKGIAISRAQEIEPCAVVYLPADYKGPIKPVLEMAEKHRILTVSDRTNFVDDGGMIELTPNAGRYAFDVNLLATRGAELKLGSQMLKLARTVK